MLCIASTAFAQKCKEKYPDVIVSKGGGPGINAGGPRIKDKPQPEYTEEARRHEISGTVLLRAVFHSSGKVRDVCWVSSLPYGLTENAIKAAYQIRFEPLERDGRPLSVAMLVEYNFQLY
jgi:TonB family protein